MANTPIKWPRLDKNTKMKWIRRMKANRPKTTAQKLKERLVSEFGLEIPNNEMPKRLYHGHHQRSFGAWSWSIGGNVNWIHCYGSPWSMLEVLKAKHIILFNEHGHEVSILVVTEKEYNDHKAGIQPIYK